MELTDWKHFLRNALGFDGYPSSDFSFESYKFNTGEDRYNMGSGLSDLDRDVPTQFFPQQAEDIQALIKCNYILMNKIYDLEQKVALQDLVLASLFDDDSHEELKKALGEYSKFDNLKKVEIAGLLEKLREIGR